MCGEETHFAPFGITAVAVAVDAFYLPSVCCVGSEVGDDSAVAIAGGYFPCCIFAYCFIHHFILLCPAHPVQGGCGGSYVGGLQIEGDGTRIDVRPQRLASYGRDLLGSERVADDDRLIAVFVIECLPVLDADGAVSGRVVVGMDMVADFRKTEDDVIKSVNAIGFHCTAIDDYVVFA